MANDVLSIPISNLNEPFHTGSVQRLHEVDGRPDLMVSETTVAGSVFDVGSIFEIGGSDVTRALFRHELFCRLADPRRWLELREELTAEAAVSVTSAQLLQGPLERLVVDGARTHHLGMLDGTSGQLVMGRVPEQPSRFNVVRRFAVHHPPRERVLGGSVFDYSWFSKADGYVIPLEYLVRFGITTGSSVWKRYQKAGEEQRRSLLQEWGVHGSFEPWKLLTEPLVDCSSKYEPEDRAVSRQESMMMSGLPADAFGDSLKLALLGGRLVRRMVAEIGLQLWDLKWELAVDGAELVFVDTVDTDSIRATLATSIDGHEIAMNVNKQAMRDYYRICHGEWLAAVDRAKARAMAGGVAFAGVLKAGVESGEYPPVPSVAPAFLEIQADKMRAVFDWLRGLAGPGVVRARLLACAQAEAEFYRAQDRFNPWLALTGTAVAAKEVGQ